MRKPSPAVVVTGVSTGIGNCTLHELINAGYHVFGSVKVPTVFRMNLAMLRGGGAAQTGSRQALGPVQ